jgi:hypothetical protein
VQEELFTGLLEGEIQGRKEQKGLEDEVIYRGPVGGDHWRIIPRFTFQIGHFQGDAKVDLREGKAKHNQGLICQQPKLLSLRTA